LTHSPPKGWVPEYMGN